MPGGCTLGDGLSKYVLAFSFNSVHGCSHLGGPVEGEANVHSKVFVGVVRWQVGGISLSHRYGVVKL